VSQITAAALHQRLHEGGVHTLLVQFTDLHGVAKGKLVPLAHLNEVLATGAGFSGPSIWGTGLARTGPRSEYYARGDAATALPLPWLPGVARIVGDGFVDGQPFDACPRQVLKTAVQRLAARGWRLEVGIEPEFFLLKRDPAHAAGFVPADDHDRLDKPSYDLKSLARQAPFLHALRHSLEACGFDLLQLDHEDAHGQYEVNFAHADALASADRLMLFKLAAHALAEERGMVFSMMPKPFVNQPGSGMHFHVSLWEGERCLFDAGAPTSPPSTLSPLGRHFVGGVLAHAPALCALAAPTVNSYKRLTVGESLSGTTWAPATIGHGPNNRTALVRTLPGRFEWRLPDAATNPYLACAGLIAAGLDGIERRLDPGPDLTDDLFTLPLATLRARGIGVLPQSLGEAVAALAADQVLRGALGPTLAEQFIVLKSDEHLAYTRHVTAWEMARYADAF
jgi:glutamine synthetase